MISTTFFDEDISDMVYDLQSHLYYLSDKIGINIRSPYCIHRQSRHLRSEP